MDAVLLCFVVENSGRFCFSGGGGYGMDGERGGKYASMGALDVKASELEAFLRVDLEVGRV